MQDLTQYQKGQLLLNKTNKEVFILVSNDLVTVRRVTLFNAKTGKETTYEVTKERPVTLDREYSLIQPGFALDRIGIDWKEIDLETLENFTLSEQNMETLKAKLTQVNNPYPYPSEETVKHK